MRNYERDPELVAVQANLDQIGAGLRDATPHFNGPAYLPFYDHARLTGQILRVFACMRDGAWRTLGEIEAATGDPQSSISAQLRHLRKARFGGHTVAKRARGSRHDGLFEYSLTVNTTPSKEVA